MRKRRGPFTDPREGRLLREIDCAFTAHKADVLTTTVLLDWCYGARVIRKIAGDPSWHREMVKRAALKICIPLGRSPNGSGRPMMWKLDPEEAALRGWRRREKRYQGQAGPRYRHPNTP